MDINEIKQLIKHSRKINNNETTYSISIPHLEKPAVTDPLEGYKLVGKYAWIIDELNLDLVYGDSENASAIYIDGNDFHENSFERMLMYFEVEMKLITKLDKSVVRFHFKSNSNIRPGNEEGGWNEEEADIEKSSIISRIQVFGNQGLSFKSNWQRCFESGKESGQSDYVFGSSTILTDMFSPTTWFPSISLFDGTTEAFIFENFYFVIVEVAKSLPNSLDPKAMTKSKVEQRLEHVLLTNDSLFSQKQFMDMEIIIIGKDGKVVETLMAHKAVLAARSEIFRAMFQAPMKERKLSCIEVVDFGPKTINELLQYLYIGKSHFGETTDAAELYRCADKYHIIGLMDLCENFMAQNIELFGWGNIFNLFHMYDEGLEFLRDKVKQYFRMNESALKDREDFQTAIKMYPEQFFKLYL